MTKQLDGPQNYRDFDELSDLNLPKLDGEDIDIDALRSRHETTFSLLVWTCALSLVLLFVLLLPLLLVALVLAAMSWIHWKFFRAWLSGHALKVTETHLPQIHVAVKLAADAMKVDAPDIYILQGDGWFDVLIARRYSKRGLIIFTSGMMDRFAEEPTSREFMFLIGRQLGHIRAGHFRWWWIRDSIGRFSGPIYFAWSRRCHLTADRVGLMVAGDAQAAFRALSLLTVGAGMAPSCRIRGAREQAASELRGFWCWLSNLFSTYPFMIRRMICLADHARQIQIGNAQGVFAIEYPSLKPQSLVLIHGHDQLALLQLKDFLRENYPLLDLRIMQTQQHGAISMPEKFEMVAQGAVGAIALMTPDDEAAAVRARENTGLRARQNVIMEIGWFWARLGRERILLLSHGEIEIPSDFSGVEVLKYDGSLQERLEDLRKFLGQKLRVMASAECSAGVSVVERVPARPQKALAARAEARDRPEPATSP